jgi:predicted RNase H-like nuclease (RuvC/YqgF family)
LDTAKDRAAVSGASHRTQQNADKVAKADPELARQVAHGEVSLPKAVAQVEAKKPRKKKPNPPKPEPEPKAAELAEVRKENGELHTFCSEQGKIIKELLAENESLGTVADSDDKLAAALAEAKKFRDINQILDGRIRGLQNEVNECKRAAKSWQNKFLKLEKSIQKGGDK